MYVGSVQDRFTVHTRHRRHVQESKCTGLIGPWLRNGNEGRLPSVVEIVPYNEISRLFERENYWMQKLGTRFTNGGLNIMPAGGPDFSLMGKIYGHLGGRALSRSVDPEMRRVWGRQGATKQSHADKVKAAQLGGKRYIELYGSPQTIEGSRKGQATLRKRYSPQQISEWAAHGSVVREARRRERMLRIQAEVASTQVLCHSAS